MRTSFVRYVSPTPRHTSFRKERAIVGAARGRSASAIPDLELIHPGVSDLNRETPFGNSTRILSVVVAHLHCAERRFWLGCVASASGSELAATLVPAKDHDRPECSRLFCRTQERALGARADLSNTWKALGSEVSSERYDRVAERRRAVALARHFRESEGLSTAQIAERLGRAPATVKAYFYDPTGEKARAVKARYVGVCRGCGAYTQPRNGKGDAYAYCKACHPGAIQRRWTRERVLDAMGEWRDRYGRSPSSYDWSVTHARRRGGEALRRLEAGEWPPASVVTSVFGSWTAARAAAEVAVTMCDGERDVARAGAGPAGMV